MVPVGFSSPSGLVEILNMGRQQGQDFGALLQVWKLPFVNASAIAFRQQPEKINENKKEKEVKHEGL